MAKDKKAFILYCDLLQTISKLPDDIAGKLFKIILEYVNDLNPVVDDLLLQVAFEPIKQQLKRDLKDWELGLLGKSEGGKKSAEIRKKLKNMQDELSKLKILEDTSSNSTVTVTVTDTVTDTVTVIDQWFLDLENSQDLENIARINNLDVNYVKSRIRDFRPKAELEYPTHQKFISHFKNFIVKNKNELIKPKSVEL